mmetsp:Transcript_71875/g.198425  ORF Transcript_71875/g.198425 Transcript_71875/m.198425 type:complete len:203 (+) Transcript_71875:297-905(+)
MHRCTDGCDSGALCKCLLVRQQQSSALSMLDTSEIQVIRSIPRSISWDPPTPQRAQAHAVWFSLGPAATSHLEMELFGRTAAKTKKTTTEVKRGAASAPAVPRTAGPWPFMAAVKMPSRMLITPVSSASQPKPLCTTSKAMRPRLFGWVGCGRRAALTGCNTPIAVMKRPSQEWALARCLAWNWQYQRAAPKPSNCKTQPAL